MSVSSYIAYSAEPKSDEQVAARAYREIMESAQSLHEQGHSPTNSVKGAATCFPISVKDHGGKGRAHRIAAEAASALLNVPDYQTHAVDQLLSVAGGR